MEEVLLRAGEAEMPGFLEIPEGAKALVLFVHGTGSGRLSPRNQYVAQVMREAGMGTLLLDLLSPDAFDIDLLTERVVAAIDWLTSEHPHLTLGLIGSSTGASGALMAAAVRPKQVAAVVSRGGRPDLASAVLGEVQAPTLLIVGGSDLPVLELNRQALAMLETEKRLEIVPEATHLFEEPGTLERAAELARDWFLHHL